MPEEIENTDALLKRLEWSVLRKLDGLIHGDYRTLFRGYGLDLADLREYKAEDEVRYIDWNVTARLQVPYVRQYNEEREVTAWFLLDTSPSIDFGSEERDKRSVLAGFVAVLARLLTMRGNRVGAILYSDRIDRVIPPRSGRVQVLHILESIRNRPDRKRSESTDLGDFLQKAGHILKRRSLLFVVSDFISAPGWSEPLSDLSRRHEALAIRLYDPLERNLPDLGLFLMQDSETGEQLLVDSNDPGFRKRFAELAESREAELLDALAKAGVDTLELSTTDDLLESLIRFIELRTYRSSRAGARSLPGHMEASL
ncbi:MAG: DUF58 domain-containing protein [Balneolaceae bacterium]